MCVLPIPVGVVHPCCLLSLAVDGDRALRRLLCLLRRAMPCHAMPCRAMRVQQCKIEMLLYNTVRHTLQYCNLVQHWNHHFSLQSSEPQHTKPHHTAQHSAAPTCLSSDGPVYRLSPPPILPPLLPLKPPLSRRWWRSASIWSSLSRHTCRQTFRRPCRQ